MNHYGAMAQRHWARWLPHGTRRSRTRAASSRCLGTRQREQIDDLALDLAGDDQPGEGYLEKAGRLDHGPPQAEEIVLPERVLLDPEPETSEEPDETCRRQQAAAGRGPQPSAVGAGERGAGGTGPGQLAGSRSARAARTISPPLARSPGSAPTWPRCTTLRALQREDRPAHRGEQAVLARWSGGARCRRSSTPPGRSSPGPATNSPPC